LDFIDLGTAAAADEWKKGEKKGEAKDHILHQSAHHHGSTRGESRITHRHPGRVEIN
jgi:hypothetical protein